MGKKVKKIAHITSVHNRYDARIFLKECVSLTKLEYTVYLIVADGYGNEVNSNVSIIDIGKRDRNRYLRMVRTTLKMYKKVKKLKPVICHFHDPELMPIGLLLKINKIKVIYDVHEDIPKQILRKHWIKRKYKKLISRSVNLIDQFFSVYFDLVITVTESIQDKYKKWNDNVVTVKNYVKADEITPLASWSEKERAICYIGNLSEAKGLFNLISMMSQLDCKLIIAGKFHNKEDESKFYKSKISNVVFVGYIGREEIQKILNVSKVGLLLLPDVPGYSESLPVKMFEYMAAGLPLVASNFPLWKTIIENNECGFCVDPDDHDQTRKKILYLLNNHEKAFSMGMNGRKAIENYFNWELEEKKLLYSYKRLIDE